MGASTTALVLESVAAAMFLAVAVSGFKSSLWIVVVALAAHGVFDLWWAPTYRLVSRTVVTYVHQPETCMRTQSSASLAISMTLALVLATACRSTPRETMTDRVDRLFAAWNRPDSPGCGVGVSRNGAVI